MARISQVFLMVSAFFCQAAYAFHPLISEDTGFLGKGVRQVEAGFEHIVLKEGTDVYGNALGMELSYGLTDNADLLLTAPWRGWSSGGLSGSGIGSLALETKFRIARKAGWVFALKPGFFLPAGDDEKGPGAGKRGIWLYGLAGKTAGPVQYYLNTGCLLNVNSSGEEKNIFKASAAAAIKAAPRTLVSADLTIETNSDPSAASHPLSSVFGFIWSPSASLDLDAGVKLGLNNAAAGLGLLAGATFRF